MSGRRRERMARRARGRTVACRLLPPRVHAARPDRRYRLPEQGSIYDLLFKAAAEATLTIAADPKHLGARIGITAVLHSWGSAMTHHPHVHMIVPGGGLCDKGERWIACRPTFFLPVRVLSRRFRRLFLKMLAAAHEADRLKFFGDHAALADKAKFAAFLAPLRKVEWVVYAKKPFGGPQAVLAYLSRYTHRVAISNRRLISANETGVTFKWKDYRIEGHARYKTMTLPIHEFPSRWGCCHPHTGSPEAVARLRFPQNVACRFTAPRSSAGDSQHCKSLQLRVRETQLWFQ